MRAAGSAATQKHTHTLPHLSFHEGKKRPPPLFSLTVLSACPLEASHILVTRLWYPGPEKQAGEIRSNLTRFYTVWLLHREPTGLTAVCQVEVDLWGKR